MANGLQQIPVSRDQGPVSRNQFEFTDGDVLVKMVRDHDTPTCCRQAGILAVNGQRAMDAANHSGIVFRKPPRANPLE